ncbi:IGFBP N-terminal domain-containing protein [Caerostris darwini]|uniref:IGFBP N-terminal domain-containing protein n=1 Tax=Caerostris darwini TaxID=1538125 RepID=A0AAV4MLV3_9ARAC|nr:IGFBP N-terminal domain-containing protein [Caerostris darwini]
MMLRLCCLLCFVIILSVRCDERLEDRMVEEEDKGFGDEGLSSFGGVGLDNMFSSGTPLEGAEKDQTTTTATVDVETSRPVTTVSPKDVTSTETKTPVPLSNPTTHKIDPKKDLKKKNKPTSFKKKDKHLDEEETVELNHDKVKVTAETTTVVADVTEAPTTTTENVPTVATTPANPTTTEVIMETTTSTQVSHDVSHTDTMRLSRDESDTTTMAAAAITEPTTVMSGEEEMLKNKQEETTPSQLFDGVETTMNPETPTYETMNEEDTGETNAPQTTTNGPTIVETTLIPQETTPTHHPDVLIVTENNEPVTTTINTIPVGDGVTEILPKSEENLDDNTEENTVANEPDHEFTTVHHQDAETTTDGNQNNLNNDLGDPLTTVRPEIVEVDATTMPPGVRKQKQMDLEKAEEPCLCDDPKVVVECVGVRTLPDPNCPCRRTCARQSGESCSPGEPCDEEFGLRCSLQNNTCHGKSISS